MTVAGQMALLTVRSARWAAAKVACAVRGAARPPPVTVAVLVMAAS